MLTKEEGTSDTTRKTNNLCNSFTLQVEWVEDFVIFPF